MLKNFVYDVQVYYNDTNLAKASQVKLASLVQSCLDQG